MTRSSRTKHCWRAPWGALSAGVVLVLLGLTACDSAARPPAEARAPRWDDKTGPIGIGHIEFREWPASLFPLIQYELVDPDGAVSWRCAERGVGKAGLPQCLDFPVSAGRGGTYTLVVRSTRRDGTPGALLVPFYVTGKELRVDIEVAADDEGLWSKVLGSWFHPPPGVRIEHADANARVDGDSAFRLVNESAFDVVVTGDNAEGGVFGALVSMSAPGQERCMTCGNGIILNVVRRGESIPIRLTCGSTTSPGQYAVVVSGYLRDPGLPHPTSAYCDPPCSSLDLRSAVAVLVNSELQGAIGVWGEFAVDADGRVTDAPSGAPFGDWMTRTPPMAPWPTFTW